MIEIAKEKEEEEQRQKEKEMKAGSGAAKQDEEMKEGPKKNAFGQIDYRTKECTHPIGQRCLKCLDGGEKVTAESAKKCVCRAGQKCVICLGVTKDNMQDVDARCHC